MKITFRKLACRGALALIALVIGVAGCKTSGDRTLTQKESDHAVAKAVDKKLAQDPMYKYPDVRPIVYDGNVQLTGVVNTSEQRQRAAELAASATGVRQVINDLMIKPLPTGPATIRDAYGRESGRLLIEPNAPPHNVAPNVPPPQAAPQQSGQSEQGAGPTGGGANPNQQQ